MEGECQCAGWMAISLRNGSSKKETPKDVNHVYYEDEVCALASSIEKNIQDIQVSSHNPYDRRLVLVHEDVCLFLNTKLVVL